MQSVEAKILNISVEIDVTVMIVKKNRTQGINTLHLHMREQEMRYMPLVTDGQ